jgi:hypothetical protein
MCAAIDEGMDEATSVENAFWNRYLLFICSVVELFFQESKYGTKFYRWIYGSGKTTIGRLIGKKLGLEFIDLDAYIKTNIIQQFLICLRPKVKPEIRQLEKKFFIRSRSKRKYCGSYGVGEHHASSITSVMKQSRKTLIILNASRRTRRTIVGLQNGATDHRSKTRMN